jgi:pimeloyl-ACP methyl ester carboxylesterase
MWLGTSDARWFRVKGTNLWVPSAYIWGNPPTSSPTPNFDGIVKPKPIPTPVPGLPYIPLPSPSWSWISKDGESVRVGLNRIDGSLSDIQDRSTWIVVHGMNSSPDASNISRLATTVGNYRSDDQVFTLDWRDAASSGYKLGNDPAPDPKRGGSWITKVAEFVGKKLDEWKVSLWNINVVGHSLGSYVAYEIGKYFNGRRNINRLIALDPATTTNGGYGGEPSVNFSNYSDWAWGFYGSLLGHDKRAQTAEESFKFDFGGINLEKHHGAVVDAFSGMLEKNNNNQAGNVSKLFNLDGMTNPSSKPWQRHDGFEAVLKPKEEGERWKPDFLEYYKGGWDGAWNWPDIRE